MDGNGRDRAPWADLNPLCHPPLVDEGLPTLRASRETVEMFKAKYSRFAFFPPSVGEQGEGSNQNR